MRNISAVCLKLAALYFKVILNSIEFYKIICLHVIPVRMFAGSVIVQGEFSWAVVPGRIS